MTDGLAGKSIASAIVLVLMVPGLIIEPGPLSEIIGFAALGSIWGIDALGDADDS
jgi:hypothetical protein